MKTRSRKKPPRAPLVHLTIALTTEASETLQSLALEASDAIGRTIGQSALVRALLHWTAQQPRPFEVLLPFLEEELNQQGLFWGKPPKNRQPKR